MKKIGKSSMLMAVLEDMHTSRLPGEMTINELLDEARSAGIKVSRNTMERQMASLVREGKLKRRKGIENGKVCNLYSQP